MIQRIELTGFQSHQHTVLEMVPGLNVLVGETNSGKTAVLRAIEWVVRNRPLKPQNELLSRKSDECVVEITTSRGSVRREWSKKFNGYVLTDTQGKKATYRDLRGDVPPEVRMILDLGDINIQDQWSPVFLFDLSPGQVSRYVSDLLGFDPLDQAVSRAKTWAQERARDAVRMDAELKEARAELERFSYVDALLPRMARVEAKEQRIARLVEELRELRRAAYEVAARRLEVERLKVQQPTVDLDSLQDKIHRIEQLEERRDELLAAADCVRSARGDVETRREEFAAAERELDAARTAQVDALIDLRVCPTCGADVDRERVVNVSAL